MEEQAARNVIIIGSGPAGLTAAIYAARANLKPLVLEGFNAGGLVPGGQLMFTTDVENYPGFVEKVTGPDLMQRFRGQAERQGAELVTQDVEKVDRACRPHGVAHMVVPLIIGRASRAMGDAILDRIAELRAAGGRAWTQVSPRVGLDRKFGFDGTAAQFAMMPSWVQAVNASGEAKRRILRDPEWRARAR